MDDAERLRRIDQAAYIVHHARKARLTLRKATNPKKRQTANDKLAELVQQYELVKLDSMGLIQRIEWEDDYLGW